MKDLFIEAYEEIMSEAEETSVAISENRAGEMAHVRSVDAFAGMCDAAKDRAKYQDLPTKGSGVKE